MNTSNGNTTEQSPIDVTQGLSGQLGRMSGLGSPCHGWVHLNVGGRVFATTKSTLSKDPKSFFHRLINATQDENDSSSSVIMESHRDHNGAYLIDRDPAYFAPVLNYLRHGRLVIDKHVEEEGVLEEAEFYNVTGLIDLVKERIRRRDEDARREARLRANANQRPAKKVYRVMQCQDKELTNLVSTLTDGWEFVQLVSIGSLYQYGNEDNAEFLCLVSKQISGPPETSAIHHSHHHSGSGSGEGGADQGAATNNGNPAHVDQGSRIQGLGQRMRPL